MKKIRKNVARNLYVNRKPFIITPAHCGPMAIFAYKVTNFDSYTFDQLVNSFEYYNCINEEVGSYATFWIEQN